MAYLKRAADPKMLEVCVTVPFRIVVVSSGEVHTLTDTSQLPFVSHVRVPHIELALVAEEYMSSLNAWSGS